MSFLKANSLKILLKRENLTKKRLDMMDVLDSNNRSRQKGFELFRYYDILYHKRQLLGETFQQQVSLEESLVESYILLKDDINRPNPLLYCYDKMVSALGSDHHIDCLTQKILSRYNWNLSSVNKIHNQNILSLKVFFILSSSSIFTVYFNIEIDRNSTSV